MLLCVYVCMCTSRALLRGCVEGLAAASRRGRTEEVSFVVVSFPRSKTAIQKENSRSLSLSLPLCAVRGKETESADRGFYVAYRRIDGRHVSRRGFSLGRGLRKSLSLFPSPPSSLLISSSVPLYPSVIPSYLPRGRLRRCP